MTRDIRSQVESDPPIVCRLTPDGDLICEPAPVDAAAARHATTTRDSAGDAAALLEDAIAKVFPGAEWGPERTRLAVGLIEALATSALPDDRVPRRAGQCIGAVRDLLRDEPPSILCFNYSQQPADVFGAWYLNRAQLARMQRVLRQFEDPVQP